MKKEEKQVKNKRVSIITLVVLLLVIIGLVAFVILQKDNIRMNSLIKKDNIIASKSVTGGERVEIYPSTVHERYINITNDGILYVMEDNGYNVDDKNWKGTLISEQTIGTNNLEVLKFEMNNLMSVSPEDKINDGSSVNYIELTLNGNTRTVYEKEFYSVLQRYNIYIEGEDYESL